jgi:hypothetical protein
MDGTRSLQNFVGKIPRVNANLHVDARIVSKCISVKLAVSGFCDDGDDEPLRVRLLITHFNT